METPSHRNPIDAQACVFIASSNNTFDVLFRVMPSVTRYWPDCPYPILVGTNGASVASLGAQSVFAPVSGWRNELTEQLRQISCKRVILLLDDFLIQAPVDQRRVAQCVELTNDRDLAYLRLLPLERSIASRLAQLFSGRASDDIENIDPRRPYHSALQIAVWRREYLLEALAQPVSIWEFEHGAQESIDHFAVKSPSLIRYRHLVEKSQWLPDAATLLRKAGLPSDLGSRPVWPTRLLVYRWLAALRFQLIGYSAMRLRRHFFFSTRRRPVVH